MSYDQFAATFSKSRKDHPWPVIDAIIADIREHGYMIVLDIGCGNGRFLEEIQNSGYALEDYLGIDSSLGMIKEAQKLHHENKFEVKDMSDLAILSTGSLVHYDAIVLLASFHHLESETARLEVLASMRSLLAPKGRVYMTNWNLLDQPRYASSHRGGGDFDIKIGAFSRYYHGFTLEELSSLFRETGWNIERHEVYEGGRNILSILS